MSRGVGAEYSFFNFALALFSAFCISADAVSVESSSRDHNRPIEIVEKRNGQSLNNYSLSFDYSYTFLDYVDSAFVSTWCFSLKLV